MTNPLTRKQFEILQFIEDFLAEKGYPPAVREIMSQFAIKSPNGVVCHLKPLEKKGFIRRDAEIARGIKVLKGTKGIEIGGEL